MNTVGNRPISKLWFESKVRFFAHSSLRAETLQLWEGCELFLPPRVSPEGQCCVFSAVFMDDRAITNTGGHVPGLSSYFLTLETNALLMSLVMMAVRIRMAHQLTIVSGITEHHRHPILNFNVSLNLGAPLELTHFSLSNKSLRRLWR